MAFILVYLFCIFLFLRAPKGSITRLVSLIFLASLSGYALFYDKEDFQLIDIIHAVWIMIVLGCVVWPWKDYRRISVITITNKSRTETVANILIVLCITMGVSCAILAYFVMTQITDISAFKYVDGTSDFYYSLGIDMKGFILTTLLYPLGYLLIPFVFYYISRKRTGKALLCFWGSMLPVFYGMTYFSRAHMTHFILVYIAAFFLLRNIFDDSYKKWLTRIAVVLGIGVLVGFSAISISRFEDHDYSSNSEKLNTNSSSSTVVSSIDYFSMWWPNSQEMFRRFDGTTMGSSIIMQSVDNFLSTVSFGIWPNHSKARIAKREDLFKEFSGSFIGVGAYVLYDQGPIIGVLLLVIYASFVKRHRPRNKKVDIPSLMTTFALIQIPMFAIFYSAFDIVLLTLIFLIPIKLFLKGGRIRVKEPRHASTL